MVEALRASNDALAPIEDPLQLRLGLHRWLASDREEAYSDWLAWVLEELATPERVGWLLYRDAIPPPLLRGTEHCKSVREVWVPTGHSGQSGKLDIVARFGPEATLVIEVKVIGAESADTVKQAGYHRWLQGEQRAGRDALLIVKSGKAAGEYEQFKLLLWEDVCRNLRSLLPEIIREGRICTAALMAAFIGAVEQNLMGFPSLSGVGVGSRGTEMLKLLNKIDTIIEYLESSRLTRRA